MNLLEILETCLTQVSDVTNPQLKLEKFAYTTAQLSDNYKDTNYSIYWSLMFPSIIYLTLTDQG
jgi:hypothetical protein